MAWVLCVLLFLSSLVAVAPLFCYTCVFPVVSPGECIRFPVKCPVEQLCLSSRAVGRRGDFQVEVTERSCVAASMCGQTGHKHALGLNFTFYNTCCDTNLCNSAPTSSANYWSASAITLLLGLSVGNAAL
ncbi:protein Bouncer-like [Boleophthalmus pectinirostris]|uniref:protein Bouncer-like n=1 Tax=Boleophthalmus pectinirostris TaxID=150288 RepID=UPI00242F6CE4|nr:protein Bouncer-like [Boleophthalmus pectinirostris]